MEIPNKRLFLIREVAELFRVNPRTVRNWIDTGRLTATKYVGSLRIKREDLIEFERQGERTL
jgi:excisionase family DNA binding protein